MRHAIYLIKLNLVNIKNVLLFQLSMSGGGIIYDPL